MQENKLKCRDRDTLETIEERDCARNQRIISGATGLAKERFLADEMFEILSGGMYNLENRQALGQEK